MEFCCSSLNGREASFMRALCIPFQVKATYWRAVKARRSRTAANSTSWWTPKGIDFNTSSKPFALIRHDFHHTFKHTFHQKQTEALYCIQLFTSPLFEATHPFQHFKHAHHNSIFGYQRKALKTTMEISSWVFALFLSSVKKDWVTERFIVLSPNKFNHLAKKKNHEPTARYVKSWALVSQGNYVNHEMRWCTPFFCLNNIFF